MPARHSPPGATAAARFAMTFPGSRAVRSARHRARPVTRIVSRSKTGPVGETRLRPSADTTTPPARALFFAWLSAFDSNRTGPSTSPILPGQGHFSIHTGSRRLLQPKPRAGEGASAAAPAVLAVAGWGRLSCGCAVRVRSARIPGPGRHGRGTSWMTS
jgi:hypothetical protein